MLIETHCALLGEIFGISSLSLSLSAIRRVINALVYSGYYKQILNVDTSLLSFASTGTRQTCALVLLAVVLVCALACARVCVTPSVIYVALRQLRADQKRRFYLSR